MNCDDYDPYFADKGAENSEIKWFPKLKSEDKMYSEHLSFSDFQWQDYSINFQLLL